MLSDGDDDELTLDIIGGTAAEFASIDGSQVLLEPTEVHAVNGYSLRIRVSDPFGESDVGDVLIDVALDAVFDSDFGQ
jgi:hypothetical protein